MSVTSIATAKDASDIQSRKRRKARAVPTNAITVRQREMEEMLGVGATKAGELIRTGAVRSVLIGRTRLISVESIRALARGEAA